MASKSFQGAAFLLLLICTFSSVPSHGHSSHNNDVVQHVQLLGGTYSRFDYSRGSLLPFVGRPWSMNNWAVQSNNLAGGDEMGPMTHWWFHPEDRRQL